MVSNGMEEKEVVRYFVLHPMSKIYHEIGKCAIQVDQAFCKYAEPPEDKILCGECMKGDAHD